MTGAILMGIAGFALKARKRAVVSGAEALVGSTGQVVSWKDGSGTIRVHGEIWSARGQEIVAPPEMVRVVSRQGLVLDVTPANSRRHP
jgi:membrane-bound serine protease (ClpP class)